MCKALVLTLMLLHSAVACSNPRDNLQASGSQGTRQLSEEKRKEYDVLFFNEFSVFTHNRPGINECRRREALFRQMADEGYEVAGIALQLYDIGRCDDRGRYDEAARDRLEQLAGQGDTAAMCFLNTGLVWIKPPMRKFEEHANYIRLGAEQGHPDCMFTLALYYEDGLYGVPMDHDNSLQWMEKAARSGNLRAQSGLQWRYQMGEGVDKDLAIALCWARAAAESGDKSGSNAYKNDLIMLQSDLVHTGKRHLIEAQDGREHRSGKACDL
jgi:TPR repeat protein